MSTWIRGRTLIAAGAIALFFGSASLAQDDSATAGAQRLTDFESWALRCMPRENAAPCDIVQSLNDGETGAQVIAVSLAYFAADAVTAMQIIAPLGVYLPKGLTIAAGDTTASGIRFARCELQGCFVEGRLGDDVVASMRNTDTINLTFGVSAENNVTITMEMAGFAEAYDALIAETTARTSPREE